ncbi:MAG: ATP-binding protein [Bryobacterales bacterium]|nr:ATP-binding protein [Bryobacteraceae bacterium]MDW8129505.1 ATP-binding protein [Bryobacterales bacterium]
MSIFTQRFEVRGRDFTSAGRASTAVKEILKEIGIPPATVRRAAIAAYEAEMNVVLYARRGTLELQVSPAEIRLLVQDEGDGIPDIELAMQEGYSTASEEIREMGFGAGMGLPNIRKNSDEFRIESVVGQGTALDIRIRL